MAHRLYFRPETGCEDRFGKTYGPYEYLQLTYGELRISPNGDSAMGFVDNRWQFAPAGEEVGHGLGVIAHPDDVDKKWTDIVIFELAEVPLNSVAPAVQQLDAVGEPVQ